jgi:iron complex transport system substrate-binding protein
MLKVVSLLASATEIVWALGLGEQLVGRSHECDYPPSVKRLPICTSPKFDTEGTSREIDQRVKSIVKEALGVYHVDANKLERLQPTHIITQSQCEVCAVSLKDVEQAVCQLTSSRPVIVTLEPNCLADVWADIQRVAAALGVTERGERLVAELQYRMDCISEKARLLAECPTVACIEWIDPLMAAGNWMPELVEMAGAKNLFGEAGKHSPWLSWEEIVAKDPDVIFISPCGFDIDRTLRESHLLTSKAEWKSLKAVRTGQVFIADGNQYFNRPGPRLVESLEILAEVFHPEAFCFGHEREGWIQLTERT